MPKRFTPKVHDTLYRFIAARDGEYCLDPSCHKRPPKVRLEIDHADNDPSNWDPDNLHLLCQRHNLKMRQMTTREHIRLIKAYCDFNVCVCVREKGLKDTPEIREIIDFRCGSTEMQANSHYEPVYRDFIFRVLNAQGEAEKKDLNNSASHYCGCSPVTGRRYLEKLTSSIGPLKEAKDGIGNVIVVYREKRAPAAGTKQAGKGINGAKNKLPRNTVPVSGEQKKEGPKKSN